MTIAEFVPIVLGASFAAGFLGSLTGLGGGVVVTPVLTLFLGVDLRYAIGASLVSVIATSSGAAAAYVRDGYSNIRIGMFLEIATTVGALCGAYLGTHISTSALSIVFGLILMQAAWQSSRTHKNGKKPALPDPLGNTLMLNGSYQTKRRARVLPGSSREAWVRADVRSRHPVGASGNRFGFIEGDRHGSGHAASLQSFDCHQQFHDRRDSRCQREPISQPRLREPRYRDAGYAGCPPGLARGSEAVIRSSGPAAPALICRCGRSNRDRNDLEWD